ncbi:hypothetical protein [Bosea minatitlanensis]|uniref:Uncharacterized protein n=1 Tax=Bosea minatitlanensis TaxID=128782 RepID=A0ABW0EZZ8_9HYPH|nr:hypothetical protein [Bosea minatitlanensis]MCT4492765.1 hypothetical protein [Bosea minatitlanensis]
MTLSPYQQAYDVVIRMMAECLVLHPAVEPDRIGECVDRWRMQRIAEICISEFGDDARAEARRLLSVAEGAPRVRPGAQTGVRSRNCAARSLGSALAGDAALIAPIPPAEARLARVSGETISEGRHAA